MKLLLLFLVVLAAVAAAWAKPQSFSNFYGYGSSHGGGYDDGFSGGNGGGNDEISLGGYEDGFGDGSKRDNSGDYDSSLGEILTKLPGHTAFF